MATNDGELRALVRRHGATGQLVRAVCAANGWRRTVQGAPAEWYAAFRGVLGEEIEGMLRDLQDDGPGERP